MLRAGLALATSIREEKGQSWLAKRESSTSLVSAPDDDQAGLPAHHHQRHARRSRSGQSTPVVRSRHASRSRGGSARGSRVDLSMTPIDGTSSKRYHSRRRSTGSDDDDLVPDFVDEHVRAEMAAVYGRNQGSEREEEHPSSSSDSEPDSEEEIDELEMQRLTRERGFGLGSWIDRLVEWTLFGVEEDLPAPPSVQRDAAGETNDSGEGVMSHREGSDDEGSGTEGTDDESTPTAGEHEPPTVVEKPGEKGGWEDVGWLFRVIKGSLL